MRAGERGGSVVIAVMALPLLLVFLFAVVDLGRVVFLCAEADSAAHAVCGYAKEQGEGVRAAALQEVALAAAPSLAGEGVRVFVEGRFGAVEDDEQIHQTYDRVSASFIERRVRIETRPVEVSVRVEGRYLTPLGSLLASAEGHSDATFAFTARSCLSMDLNEEGGLS